MIVGVIVWMVVVSVVDVVKLIGFMLSLISVTTNTLSFLLTTMEGTV